MTEGRLAPEEVRTRTSTWVVRGYHRREVRRLLERAADDLARLRDGPTANGPDDQPPSPPRRSRRPASAPSLGGYEMDEVDEFLDQLMVELQRATRDPTHPSAPPRPIPASGVPHHHAGSEGGPRVRGRGSWGRQQWSPDLWL